MSYLICLLTVSVAGGGSVAAVHEAQDPALAAIIVAVVAAAFVVGGIRWLSGGERGSKHT